MAEAFIVGIKLFIGVLGFYMSLMFVGVLGVLGYYLFLGLRDLYKYISRKWRT